MKKNKTMAYSLAALLLVGGTFVGTKALFTDQVTVNTELAISTGDLDIVEVQKEGEKLWTLDRNGAELSDGSTVNDEDQSTKGTIENDSFSYSSKELANNLKPGDKLKRTVTIKNEGTLVATGIKVEAENTTLENGLLTLDVDGLKETTLYPGDTAQFDLTITVNNVTALHSENQGLNSNTQENAVVDLKNAWTLTATQQDEVFTPDTVK